MSCDRYVSAITDHALGAALPDAAAAHLRSCASCAARLEDRRRKITSVDADLRRALAIAPSPDFIRKVHRRVDAERNRRAARGRWSLGLAAAAVLLIGIVSGWRPERAARDLEPGSQPVPLADASDAGAPAPAPMPAAAEQPREPASLGRVRPRNIAAVRRTSPPPVSAAPEVLVPPEQARAIARLIELVNQGALAGVDLANRAGSAEELGNLEPTPLEVAPITIPDVIITNSRSGRESGR